MATATLTDNSIAEIIRETCERELEEDPETTGFSIFVSYIMCFGYTAEEVYNYAKRNGYTIDPRCSDPDDPDDDYGSIEIPDAYLDEIIKQKY